MRAGDKVTSDEVQAALVKLAQAMGADVVLVAAVTGAEDEARIQTTFHTAKGGTVSSGDMAGAVCAMGQMIADEAEDYGDGEIADVLRDAAMEVDDYLREDGGVGLHRRVEN